MSNYMYVPVHAFCLESPFTSSFKTVWISYNNSVWNKREQTMGPTRMREIIKKTQESLWYEFFVVCFIVTAFHHHKHKCNTQCLRFFIYSFISYILAYFFFHNKNFPFKVYLTPTYLQLQSKCIRMKYCKRAYMKK